jgi:hypothetical protein
MPGKNTLTIELNKRTIKIIAQSNKNSSKHEILAKIVLSYYWSKNLPVIKKLSQLIEKVIKNTISQVFPHDILKLKYRIISDNKDIEKALSISIEFLEIKADEVDFEILGDLIVLKSINSESTLSKFIKFGRKSKKIIEKEI